MQKYTLLFPIFLIGTILSFDSCKNNPASPKNTEPIASFDINPSSGTTATIFAFDGSGCTDNEDATTSLEIRWDWENDGTYDTNFSTTKTATHQYSAVGAYTIKLEVKDSEGLTNTITKTVSLSNTAPTALFAVSPTSGTTATTFTFDANGCTDNEDATTSLEVRWDWENDGTWDTNYSTNKMESHQYIAEGTYTVNLEVKDSGTLANSAIRQITVSTIYSGEIGTMTDIDGNIYQTIKIGEQWWMAENLKVTRYKNGETFPNVIDKTQWSNHHTAAYCSYDNDDYNHSIYGKLYNWYAIDDPRGLAPDGWHIPNDKEWKKLEMFLGMSQLDADKNGYRGKYEGGKLKEIGTSLWEVPNTGATNETGFSALPGGCRNMDGNFFFIGQKAYFWMSIEWFSGDDYWNNSELSYSSSGIGRSEYTGRGGFSVRCIKD